MRLYPNVRFLPNEIWIKMSHSLGPDPHDEGGFPEGTALLLLCRHDIPGLHLLWMDRTGPVPREGKALTHTNTNSSRDTHSHKDRLTQTHARARTD